MADVWIAGRLVRPADAFLAYDDHAVTVGDAVFETVRLDGDTPFHLARHLSRLRRSAAALSLPMPDEAELRQAVNAVAATNGADQAFLRITLTAGPGPLGTPRPDLRPNLIVAVRPGTVRTEPTDVIVVPWTRNERGATAGVKTTSYAENVVALLAAEHAGASEALFANTRGELCEGTGSNVFVAIDGELVTPPLESGCLAGVTRELLLEAGVGREAAIPMSELGRADECFLASTGREVQPVRRLDGRSLPACPGPHTRAARETWVSHIGMVGADR